jgi:metal-responsive CopG/Arc/MetJ family transcriptional regulator
MTVEKEETRRGAGRPSVDTERVDVRMDRSLLDAIDSWSEEQTDRPARQEAVRRILRLWFQTRGTET